MRFGSWLMAATAFGLLALAARADARPQGKEGRPTTSEDERIARVIDQARTAFEAERDQLVPVLRRFAAAKGAAAARGDDEFDGWFRALAGGKEVWRRDAIADKPLTELFDLLASRLATGDQITRLQFLDYARQSLAEDATPSWKSVERLAQGEANRMFNELDRDRDGRLSRDEMSDALRTERRQWDADRDDFIDRTEHRAFFLSRAQKAFASAAKRAEAKDGERPAPRGGQPDGIPEWFFQLDADGDGQVGLYEWRASGWPVEDFQRLDRNGDGLLTADEIRWAVARAKARGVADEALTRKLPPDFKKKGGGVVP